MVRLAFVDVPRPKVPPYQEFVRHCWHHRAPDTGAPVIDQPPWVYSALIETSGEWALVERVIRRLVARGRVRVEVTVREQRMMRQVCFADLEALHRFLTLLAQHYVSYGTPEAHAVSEFVLWTLGFRWV